MLRSGTRDAFGIGLDSHLGQRTTRFAPNGWDHRSDLQASAEGFASIARGGIPKVDGQDRCTGRKHERPDDRNAALQNAHDSQSRRLGGVPTDYDRPVMFPTDFC